MSPKPPIRVTASLPGSGGLLSAQPDDFWVEEVLAYAPSGTGTHLFVHLEKRGWTTPEAVTQLATAWGRPDGASEAGWAGMKDKFAVATQWVSLPWPADADLPALGPVVEGLQVRERIRHGHKLRTGHVALNRFKVRLREVPEGGFARARTTAQRLAEVGLPNRFGPQRFGRSGENPDKARVMLRGTERPPRSRTLRRLWCSALQSELFNRVLDRRLEAETWRTAQEGDLLYRHRPPALFLCQDPAEEQPRVDRLEVSPTGPLFGKKTRSGHGRPAALEAEVWAEAGLTDRQRNQLGPGTRRALRVPVGDFHLEEATGGYWTAFSLPAGSYATVLLDELVKPPTGPFDRQPPNDRAPEPGPAGGAQGGEGRASASDPTFR